MAKKLLPKDAIIGISTSSIEEARKAVADGADYIGIGTMFATPTYALMAPCSVSGKWTNQKTEAEKPTPSLLLEQQELRQF